MVMIEMRGSTYDAAFELISKAKHGANKTKLALCELEECLEHCFETNTNDYEDESDYEDSGMTADGVDINIDELSYRRGMSRRMRDGMHHDIRYYERKPMKRSHMGRYSY